MASPLEGLKKIVDILNQEPFSLGLTLVTLDSKDQFPRLPYAVVLRCIRVL